MDSNEMLKFETQNFTDRCFQIYKDLIDTNIQKTYQLVYDKLESEIKNNIIQKMSGVELFDYSDIFYFKNIDHIKEIIYRICNTHNSTTQHNRDMANSFFTFEKDEKLILCCSKYHYSYPQSFTPFQTYTLLTTHGKLLSCIADSNGPTQTYATFYNIEIKIPKDYIKIIQHILLVSLSSNMSLQYYPTNTEHNPTYIQYIASIYNIHDKRQGSYEFIFLKNILDEIKTTLYNRKIVPLYLTEIVEQNKDLLEKYSKYEKDSTEFYAFKEKYEAEIKPYFDVCVEKERLMKLEEKLIEEKKRLNIIKLKLDSEKAELEKEREKLDQEKKKVYEMNIDDMLKVDEEECCICLETTSEKLVCGHFVHKDCFKKNNKNTCPICKQLC